ncbi:hypothetical protein J1N35_029163 [Gossypium stocksii]|uniref:Reverse transcriptase domain-containing protein n=1 Tax=Gossypium stocksii TaxID=47602 RepID=A0A9D3ZRT4_9ROSI|nr:hypothetical protein J1N35_029163 [Gossypium stocksii]
MRSNRPRKTDRKEGSARIWQGTKRQPRGRREEIDQDPEVESRKTLREKKEAFGHEEKRPQNETRKAKNEGWEMNEKLLEDFKDEEIIKAFNQMNQRKTPGIDGLLGNFYKEHWDVVGADILKLCHEVLSGNIKVDSLNETIIVLIPKIRNLIDMTNFRPINLYRVVYKIITKVRANRLKDTLPKCISQN